MLDVESIQGEREGGGQAGATSRAMPGKGKADRGTSQTPGWLLVLYLHHARESTRFWILKPRKTDERLTETLLRLLRRFPHARLGIR